MSPARNSAGSGKGVPTCPHGKKSMYLSSQHGPIGSSHWRHHWWMSSPLEYWQPVLLARSTDHFRKFFRIGRDRFDDIYGRAALSGKFHLHPLEPMYPELHPIGPQRHGRAQLHKVVPLCLKMTESFRLLATGESFATLSAEFRATLHFTHSTRNS